MTVFQQKLAAALPSLSDNSLSATKSASMLLEMLVILAAYSQDDTFFGIIFSADQDGSSPSEFLQHACKVVGCSVHILDNIYRKIQASSDDDLVHHVQDIVFDILGACQVRFPSIFISPAIHFSVGAGAMRWSSFHSFAAPNTGIRPTKQLLEFRDCRQLSCCQSRI
jgi:hypothetical protein